MRRMIAPAEEPAHPHGSRERIPRWLTRTVSIAAVFVAIALVVWQVRRAEPARIGELLTTSDGTWVAIALAFTLARFAVSAWRLGALTRRLVTCRLAPFFPITLAAQLAGLAIPGMRAGASVLRAALASRCFGGGTALHLGPNLLDQLIVGASWVLVAAALAPAAVLSGESHAGGIVTALVLAIVASVGLLSVLRRHGPRIEAWLAEPRDGAAGRLAGAGHATFRGAHTLARDTRALVLALALGIAFVLATGLAQHAALVALGLDVTWWLALLTVALGGVVGTATGAPGGVGVTEAAQIAFLQSQGVGQGEATAAVLLARGLHYLVIVAFGSVSALWLARLGRGAVDESTSSSNTAAGESA